MNFFQYLAGCGEDGEYAVLTVVYDASSMADEDAVGGAAIDDDDEGDGAGAGFVADSEGAYLIVELGLH